MYTFKVFIFIFISQCSEILSSRMFKNEYLNPKTMDHEKLSGRWYEQMATVNNTMRDDTIVDSVLPCYERLRSLLIFHRWISSLEECRTMAFEFQTVTPDSSEGDIIRMSTNETLGKITYRYIDPHPTEGIVVGFRQIQHVPDSYFVSSRQKDPSNLDEVIKQVVSALHLNIQDFNMKSKDFGCERKEKNGIKL